MVDNRKYLELCSEKFSFLESEYGLNCAFEKKENWGFEKIYRGEYVGVVVTFELREAYVFVKVAKLVEGEFPPRPGEMRPDTVLHAFDLEDIIRIRFPEELIGQIDTRTTLNTTFFERIAEKQATNLRKYASDILNGDFSLFSELDKIVKTRARIAAFQKWGDRAVDLGW